MSDGIAVLCVSAAGIGFVHTLLGPDHYVPFVAMSRAGGWSLKKTLLVTVLCGIGHVGSSVVIGLAGIGFGLALFKLEAIERFRGEVAGWLLIAFGLAYAVWGLRRAHRGMPHTHWHGHADGTVHAHRHRHTGGHVHAHVRSDPAITGDPQAAGGGPLPAAEAKDAGTGASLTPWVLFTIFLFGPCELLIPMLMVPAARGHMGDVALVTIMFGVTTLVTMVAVVAVAHRVLARPGLASRPHLTRLAPYGHALAGLVILLCGAAVQAGL
ncbi:MAG: hypothetical protein ACE5EX_04325 [Phycisphaerae bacterium]